MQDTTMLLQIANALRLTFLLVSRRNEFTLTIIHG